jgi:hypothetical protein
LITYGYLVISLDKLMDGWINTLLIHSSISVSSLPLILDIQDKSI